jgi:1,2-diacylglycerol 3-alpha-glucosyltransferase
MSSAPRAVALFTECFTPVGNGVVRSVQTLREMLIAKGSHVSVVAPIFPEHDVVEKDVYRLPSTVIPTVPYPITNIAALGRNRSIIHEVPADIIHTHHPFLIGRLGMGEAKRRGIPLISTAHTRYDLYSHHIPLVPGEATRTVTARLIRWYYNRCTIVITPSNDTRQYLRESGVRTRIEVVPTGVALPDPSACSKKEQHRVRKELHIPEKAQLLLCVGRLYPEKSPEVALEAFLSLASEFPDLHLFFVGAGPLREPLRKSMSGRKGVRRVHFTGWLKPEQLVPLYATATLLLLPSSTETQGLVVNEAMAAGTPAIVSTVGGASEVVTNGIDSVLAEPTAEAFSAALRETLSHPEYLLSLAEASAITAKENTPNEMIDKILTIYDEALSHQFLADEA